MTPFESEHFSAERDLATVIATVDGAHLCDGLDRAAAVELELALMYALAGDLPTPRGKVVAFALEGCPFPAIARLTVRTFDDQVLLHLELFRNLAGGWGRCGVAGIELSAARAIALEILRVGPERPEGAPVQ